jgi:PHD/YefM family antitoxin component YafN of YafNO toxin-antitoxin module
VLISKEDWASLEETAHFLRSLANAARLTEAMARARRGEAV